MGIIESFFLLIGKWLGYVGACMFVPDATCRPFLAFVALGAAACAALTLVLMAYRAAQQREPAQAEIEARCTEAAAEIQGRPQRRASEPRITARPAVQTRLRAAA
jgi:hypothetical protein